MVPPAPGTSLGLGLDTLSKVAVPGAENCWLHAPPGHVEAREWWEGDFPRSHRQEWLAASCGRLA